MVELQDRGRPKAGEPQGWGVGGGKERAKIAIRRGEP